LILLDNAGSAEQIRPLLPGSGSAAVLITSRSRLAGLVARDGAHRIDLDALPLADAVELLRDRIGARAAAEPDAVVALAERCVRLPLALRVAAEFVVSRRGQPLSAVVDELAEPGRALDALSAGDDEEAAVRNVFMSSYRNLTDESAHAFRCLALYPGESFDAYVVAAVTGSDLRAAQHWLDALSQAYTIQFGEAGRFRIHDLLRAFADERCRAELDEAYRTQATTRLLDYYLSTAARAMDYAFPEESVRRPTIASGPLSLPFSEPAGARTWLDTHRAALGTLARLAGNGGRPDHLFKLAAVLWWYLHGCGYYEQAVDLHTHALQVARRLRRRSDEAYALMRLGRVRWVQVRFDESFDLLRQALPIFRELGDRWGEVGALGGLGSVSRSWGNIEEDLDYQLQTVALAAEIGDEFGQAMAMENIAYDYGHLGRYEEALRQWYAVDEIWRRTGARQSHAGVLLCIGFVHIRQGRYDEGQACYAEATSIFADLNDPNVEVQLLNILGCEAARQGRMDESLAHHRRAMQIHRANNDRFGISVANDGLGLAYLAGRRYREACEHFEIALTVARESGDVISLAGILNNLGEGRTGAGEFSLGVVHHREALDRARQTGDRFEQARALDGLAKAHVGAGQHPDARDCWLEALAIFEDIGAPEAAEIRGRLSGVAARGEVTTEARLAGL
jgi:tetratricopeptide (TPR) repeat protein